ncbi:hypothetical protein L218DRAFT_560094 [Marasmius fiardii PR-910]|nr:hypothetical protein L218DRAFT_560094 [Marasmius fiardii PR-910]
MNDLRDQEPMTETRDHQSADRDDLVVRRIDFDTVPSHLLTLPCIDEDPEVAVVANVASPLSLDLS